MITSGSHSGYHWLQGPEADLEALPSACPSAFLGRRIAVLAFDSGPLALTPADLTAGWQSVPGAAVSPPLPASGVRIPGELYSEWWVFQAPPLWTEPPQSYASYLGFSLAPADSEAYEGLTRPFWAQVLTHTPESLFLNGTHTILITRRDEHLLGLEAWLRSCLTSDLPEDVRVHRRIGSA